MKYNNIISIIAGSALIAFASGGLLASTGEGQKFSIPEFTVDKDNKKHATLASGVLNLLVIDQVVPPLGEMLRGYGMSQADLDKVKLIRVTFDNDAMDSAETYILMFQKKGTTIVCKLYPKKGVCLGGTTDMIAKDDKK